MKCSRPVENTECKQKKLLIEMWPCMDFLDLQQLDRWLHCILQLEMGVDRQFDDDIDTIICGRSRMGGSFS